MMELVLAEWRLKFQLEILNKMNLLQETSSDEICSCDDLTLSEPL